MVAIARALDPGPARIVLAQDEDDIASLHRKVVRLDGLKPVRRYRCVTRACQPWADERGALGIWGRKGGNRLRPTFGTLNQPSVGGGDVDLLRILATGALLLLPLALLLLPLALLLLPLAFFLPLALLFLAPAFFLASALLHALALFLLTFALLLALALFLLTLTLFLALALFLSTLTLFLALALFL